MYLLQASIFSIKCCLYKVRSYAIFFIRLRGKIIIQAHKTYVLIFLSVQPFFDLLWPVIVKIRGMVHPFPQGTPSDLRIRRG